MSEEIKPHNTGFTEDTEDDLLFDSDEENSLTLDDELSDEAKIAVYKVDGMPDYSDCRELHFDTSEESHTHEVQNDFFLDRLKNNPVVAEQIKAQEKRFENYKIVSGFNKNEHHYTEFVTLHRPMAAENEGSKGLTLYTHQTLYTFATMSQLASLNLTQGCSSNCAFCKESSLAKSFSQMDVKEGTGLLRFSVWLQETQVEIEIPSKAKVKFYDPNLNLVVYGPIQVPLWHGFPIAKDSLKKLSDGRLFRILAD